MFSVTCLAAFCSWGAHVRAQPEHSSATPSGEQHRIEYRAPDTCATAAVFLEEVRSRTPKLSLTEGNDWTSRFQIDVRDDGDKFIGALTVYANRSSSELREVSAKSCEEVLETLALIVAVAIDPNASLRRLPKRDEARAEDPPARTKARAKPAVTARERSKPPKVARGTWQHQLLLGAEARGAFADNASFAGTLSFEVARTFPERGRWAVRLTALRGLESSVTDPFGRKARFGWTAARIDGGPSLLAGDCSLQAALGWDMGRVEASSELSQSRWWVSALALARARWVPLGPVGFEVVAGAFIPLTRDRFALFDPDTVLYRERALSGLLGLDLYFRLQ